MRRNALFRQWDLKSEKHLYKPTCRSRQPFSTLVTEFIIALYPRSAVRAECTVATGLICRSVCCINGCTEPLLQRVRFFIAFRDIKCRVTVLTYNSADGLYYPKKDAEGKVLQTTVGASGLFCFNVQLSSGDNNLAVQAVTADNTRVQRAFFKINLVSLGWYNSIKSLINGWGK